MGKLLLALAGFAIGVAVAVMVSARDEVSSPAADEQGRPTHA